jgi:hypothetical protein
VFALSFMYSAYCTGGYVNKKFKMQINLHNGDKRNLKKGFIDLYRSTFSI